MAKPCTPHLLCAARAVLRATNCQCAGSRGKAPCVLLGDQKGAILSRERMAPFQLVKEPCRWRGFSAIIEKKGGLRMENWRKNSRKDIVMVDVDALVPKDHLLRKIENVMDYEWLYARLSPYYCADNGRPGADPVVLIKMVLLQHLYGIPSLRQTYREI